ncbi:hypothetical protein IBTHAUMO2_410009 [Nitrosopumilaceae archaeon]|nr:tetratricopeptide repeat protein [Nitrosopumilus sp.]MDA7944415.1 tetratricopeptide repeat protein [Nitrosopumilus sp.]MDA7954167.1 tetratricopeptide repeat protein [Nitrosopumilus sp.]MDA7973237.1 tetratricopeptide repeat protein [Nitrosopumilus sp.]CAI9831762.1 hypothetical protein IBTHAUMO2_410009 [Nitrosopumilaceae archaeon]
MTTRLDLKNKVVDARPFKMDHVGDDRMNIRQLMCAYKYGGLHMDRMPPGVMADLAGAYPEHFGGDRTPVHEDPLECSPHAGLGGPKDRDGHEEALRACERTLKSDPKDIDALGGRGYSSLKIGWYLITIRSYEVIIRADPANAEARTNKGVALARIGHHREALASYDLALGSDPSNPAALRNRAATLAVLGRYEEAADSYRRVLGVAPGHLRSSSCLAAILARLGRYGEALEIYDGMPGARIHRAAVLAMLGRHGEAEAAYNDMPAGDPDALSGMAALRALQGRRKESLDILDGVLRADPEHPAALAAKGAVLAGSGRRAEAAGCYDMAFRSDPESPSLLAARYDMLGGGAAPEDMRDLEERLARQGRHEEAVTRHGARILLPGAPPYGPLYRSVPVL